jgi:hypothetical protein
MRDFGIWALGGIGCILLFFGFCVMPFIYRHHHWIHLTPEDRTAIQRFFNRSIEREMAANVSPEMAFEKPDVEGT